MPEPTSSDTTATAAAVPAFPGVVPRKGTVKIIDGQKVIFDENGKP